MIDFDSHSAHTLLALARQRGEIDTVRCGLTFAHLGAAERVRRGLRSALASHHLSDLQFAILVLLFGTDPEPIAMAVLADHAGVSRSAVTDALDRLERSGLAHRTRGQGSHCAQRDSRVIPVALTAAGRERVEQAIGDYLQVAADACRHVEQLEKLQTAAGRKTRERGRKLGQTSGRRLGQTARPARGR